MTPTPPTTFNFSTALAVIKNGGRVQRAGWNGKGMFLFLVPGSTFTVNREPLLSIMGEGTQVKYHAPIDMKTAQGYVVPWLASQADMLADDWSLVGATPKPAPLEPVVLSTIRRTVELVSADGSTSIKGDLSDAELVKLCASVVRQKLQADGKGFLLDGLDLQELCAKALFGNEVQA